MMEYKVAAYHFEKQIDLKVFRNNFNFFLIKREHTFLLYKCDENSYVYMKDYGSVVFLNCNTSILTQVFKNIISIKKDIKEFPEEVFTIVDNSELEVDFGTIKVPELTPDVAHIIMLNLSQSVALTNYVRKTSELHEKTLLYVNQLEKKGNIKLSKKNMRIFIGKTMNLKNSILENLFIFDSSDLAWSQEHLSKLDYQLKDELDIVKRHQGLQFSINVIKENLELFKDILQHRYSSMLEWIIIILILFESSADFCLKKKEKWKKPITNFIEKYFLHFNAAALVDAAKGYEEQLNKGSKMLVSLAGAMSTAELGKIFAEVIRQDKVHIISCTGANLEEDIMNLVAHSHYKRVPNYRDLTPQDEWELLLKGLNRVTDTCIPEEEAFRRLQRAYLQNLERCRS